MQECKDQTAAVMIENGLREESLLFHCNNPSHGDSDMFLGEFDINRKSNRQTQLFQHAAPEIGAKYCDTFQYPSKSCKIVIWRILNIKTFSYISWKSSITLQKFATWWVINRNTSFPQVITHKHMYSNRVHFSKLKTLLSEPACWKKWKAATMDKQIKKNICW